MPKKKTETSEMAGCPDPVETVPTPASPKTIPTPRIVPIRDNILILPDPDPERTSGGLFIPKANVEMKKFVGTVVAVGEGHLTDERIYAKDPGPSDYTPYSVPLMVKRGDRVIFDKYAGSFVTQEDIEYVLIKESNVQAIVIPKTDNSGPR